MTVLTLLKAAANENILIGIIVTSATPEILPKGQRLSLRDWPGYTSIVFKRPRHASPTLQDCTQRKWLSLTPTSHLTGQKEA